MRTAETVRKSQHSGKRLAVGAPFLILILR